MTESAQIAYGLDLAGYSTGKSGLARAEIGADRVYLTIYDHHAFSVKQSGEARLPDVARGERQAVLACLAHGNLIVDVPIDLQGLPDVTGGRFVWELTKRPVDVAFGALAALADRIGAPLARFRHVLHTIDGGEELLGRRIWETYPAASLELHGLPKKGYKGTTVCSEGRGWAASKKGQVLAKILATLGWSAPAGLTVSDDDFDAALCALTGVAPTNSRLEGDNLRTELRRRLSSRAGLDLDDLQCPPPRGYVLLAELPCLPVVIARRAFGEA